MAETIWVYAEINDDRITTTSLEMLAKASEVGKAEAIVLGPAPDDATQTLAKHGASKIYRSGDAVYRDYLTLPAAETVVEVASEPGETSSEKPQVVSLDAFRRRPPSKT